MMGSKRSASRVIDAASMLCGIVFVALFLFSSTFTDESEPLMMMTTNQLFGRVGGCDEIYVVGEGETLHTISDKCGDPFILEQNSHINDHDDVFPGLVLKITPSIIN